MSLDPAIVDAVVAMGTPPPPGTPPAERRSLIDQASDRVAATATQPGPETVSVADHEVVAADGTTRNLVRLYTPSSPPVGAHLLLHGGSWAQGSPRGTAIDATARERAAAAGVLVAAAGYRLSPEHPFPAGLHDVLESWRWLRRVAEDRMIDPRAISVGGQSAGANLAAALCLLLRREGEPQPLLQLLEVPVLDLTLGSLATMTLPEVADTSGLAAIVSEYLGEDGDPTDPLASPLLAEDLTDLAPAHMMVAEHDPLRGDGEAWARALEVAGVAATCTVGTGHVHISPALTATFEPARRWRTELLETLRRAHAGAHGRAASDA